ncbi:MAG: P-loop ATPase, Sll1717 family [Methylocella sp.]
MADKFKTAFFAFPGEPAELLTTIESAAETARASKKISIKTWPEMDIFGAALADQIRSEIRSADVLICDITRPNLNVYYEIGYAIGLGKPIAPVVNRSFGNAMKDALNDGFFDGVGFKSYENSEQLSKIMLELSTHVLVELYGKALNFQQPLYLLDTFRKTDFRNAIVSAVKESKVFFRSFDPVEIPRFATIPTIMEATSSAGIVIPLLAPHVDDSSRHNLRAAYLAGISHGLNRPTMLLQMDYSTVPADYRDFVLSVSREKDIKDNVVEFAKSAHIGAQSIRTSQPRVQKSQLQKLTLGASSAENEFRTLENYFVETAEYLRTIRGEARIVSGRKGSGKTAIFFQVRDHFREDRRSFVTDLKPESHQLSLFREELLKIVDVGAFDHTLAAFWYFVLLSELLLTVRREYDHRAKRDYRALAVTTEIDTLLDRFGGFGSGDFTFRINRLSNLVVEEIKTLKAKGQSLSPERVTNIVFRGIAEIQTLIDRHIPEKTQIVLLFDNIDKSWPAQRVNEFDVRSVRLLVESLNKIRRDFEVQHMDFKSVVFLRNDIYELLVGQTPDRGKAGQIRIDWSDRANLRQVIFRRLQASTADNTLTFEQLWTRFFVPMVDGQDSFEYIVDHCLMRPRFLINIIENAIANGINRGHIQVQAQDCTDAVRQHSLYLINDFGYEIRDVSGLPSEILYSLVGVSKLVTRDEVIEQFQKFKVEDLNTAFRLMLWYGVLGVAAGTGSEHFIYDYDYDMQRLEAEIRNSTDEVLYVVNAALHVAMGE